MSDRAKIVRDAIDQILSERTAQIEEHGYTPEHDDALGANHLVTEAIYRLTHMGEAPSPVMVYQTFAEGAAMLVAAMEVVVRQQQEERK